jgi:integrase
MQLVAYSCPTKEDDQTLQSLRLYALRNHHKIAIWCTGGETRWNVLRQLYAKGEGLIIPSLSHLNNLDFLIALDEIRSRGMHLIAVAEQIDTSSTKQGEAFWQTLQSIAKAAKTAKRLGKKEVQGPSTPRRDISWMKAASAVVREIVPPTLAEAWGEFRRTKKLKPTTLVGYDYRLKKAFPDWLQRPITSITKDQIQARHADLTLNAGPATANLSMKVLRSVLNFSIARYENADGEPLLKQNPVKRLSLTGWNREKPRETYIHHSQMRDWYEAIQQVDSTARDYLLFILFTGCRKSEAANLKWRDVNMSLCQAVFRETKNHRDHTIPISRFLMSILKRRRDADVSSGRTCTYVFHGRSDRPYSFNEAVKIAVRRITLFKQQERLDFGAIDETEAKPLKFTLHDLRRTFATTAATIGVDYNSIKRLLNHTFVDVTSKYIVYDPERHRGEVEMISRALERFLGVHDNAHPAIREVAPMLAITDITS